MSGVRSGADNVKTRHFTLKQTYRVGLYAGVEIFRLDGCHRTRHFLFLLRTIAYHHYVFEKMRVFLKNNCGRQLGSFEGKRNVTHATYFDDGVCA